MKYLVLSYSLSGNNDALAESLARSLGAEHRRVVEARRRGMGRIVLDMALNLTPKVALPEAPVEAFDAVVFVAPVWMGKAASPLRAAFRRFGPRIRSYAFVSISGGALGPNPQLAGDLAARLGQPPYALLDEHIADLLPPEPKPDGRATMAYKLTEADLAALTAKAAAALAGAAGRAGGRA